MSLKIVTANTAWQLRGDGTYIAYLCGRYDVILTQESKDTDLRKVAPAGWTVLQDTTDQAHMGTGILVRDAAARVKSHELLLGVRPILRTGRRVKMLTRYLNTARLEEIATGDEHFVIDAHDAPGRFSLLQIPFWRRVKKAIDGHPHVTLGTDANAPIKRVAKRLGLKAHGVGIVGLLTGPGVKVDHLEISSWGIHHKVTDHPSVAAVVSSVEVPKPKPPAPPTPRGFMPGAVNLNIAPGPNDPPIQPIGVIQHVAVTNADSLHTQFLNDGGIESHFYVRKDGTIEQYRSIYFEADAQFAGNSFGSPRKGFVSVEHQGGVGADLNQPMPQAQLDAFHRIIQWVHQETGFPLRVCPAWDKAGVGYHAQFDQWNVDHHSCPGPARIKQFNDVTVPWLAAGGK